MKKNAIVRTMRAEDIAAVLKIQSCCYDETKLESEGSFLAKLNASPASCFIALMAESPVGYLVAVPAEAGCLPPLNSPAYSVPPASNSLYLHDLAVHPAARGLGVAAALIEVYFQSLKQLKLQFACLTAVNESSAFWERYGFRGTVPASSFAEQMATYGEGAQYMTSY